LNEAGGTRQYYPSPMMAAAAVARDSAIDSASALRSYSSGGNWFRKGRSPLGMMLVRQPLDGTEVRLRQAIYQRQVGGEVGAHHPAWRAVAALRARRSNAFTEWDGNLASLQASGWAAPQRTMSPTSLEAYATCGFRYLCRSLLRLRAETEPEERQTMEPAARGSLVHTALQRFFTEMQAQGRPGPAEPWGEPDRARLLEVLQEEIAVAQERGQTGLEVFAWHEARMLAADMLRFLAEDDLFRAETGALPRDFETDIPEVEVAGVRLRGRVDRIDRTADGKEAWIIDYKTGSPSEYKITPADPLQGGRRLQLPAYLAAAAPAERARALYWFISRAGGFKKVPYEDSQANRDAFQRTLAAIVNGIGAGAFPAVPGEEDERYGRFDHCRNCDFDRICSRRRDYEMSAKSEAGALAAWHAVAAAAGAVALGEAEPESPDE
jgi:RecB family exonuclease